MWKRSGPGGWLITNDENVLIATLHPWDESGCRDEDHRNARLIVAAQDLYNELDRLDHLRPEAIELIDWIDGISKETRKEVMPMKNRSP